MNFCTIYNQVTTFLKKISQLEEQIRSFTSRYGAQISLISFKILPFMVVLLWFLCLKDSLTKEKIAKIKRSDRLMAFTGCYSMLATILDCLSRSFSYWHLLQLIVAISMITYTMEKKNEVPSWKIGRRWLISVMICLPLNVLWHWSTYLAPPFTFLLASSLAHLALTLCVLPLYMSLRLVGVMMLAMVYIIYGKMQTLFLVESTLFLTLLALFSLIFFVIMFYNRPKLSDYKDNDPYLKNKIDKQEHRDQTERERAFSLYSELETVRNNPKEAHAFIDQIMQEVTQFISYLDERPLYKENLDLITNNFVIWDIFLKQRSRSKNHIVLLPTQVTLDELIKKLKVALELESKGQPMPNLIIESKDDTLPDELICDVSQMVCLLTPVVLSIASLDSAKEKFVKIQVYTTHLKYELKSLPDHLSTADVLFPAIALVVSNASMSQDALPEIKNYYEDVTAGSEFKWHSIAQKESEWTNIEKRTIERIVRTHYGYLQFPPSPKRPMVIVVPCDVSAVRNAMIDRILPSEPAIFFKEYRASLVTLTKAYNRLCTLAEMRTIVLDELFLLMRRCYGYTRHESGQLAYIRAVGIAQLVAEWIPAQPRPVYFSILYGLVRYAGLPLCYIKANYGVDVYSFVERIVTINKRQKMEPCGLYVGNRLKRIINREQLFILCVKFAERLYDLRHAKDYVNLEEVKYMAQETLTIDIDLGKKYLNVIIVEELVKAANQALQLCEGVC